LRFPAFFADGAADGRADNLWFIHRTFVLVPAQVFVAKHLATYKAFPPRQRVKPTSLVVMAGVR
jgi:hypothetical protein